MSGKTEIAFIVFTTTRSTLSTTLARAKQYGKCTYLNTLFCSRLTISRAFSDIYYLIDKYAPFPMGEGPPKSKKSEMASLSAERDHIAG